jgi:hypothetical protein
LSHGGGRSDSEQDDDGGEVSAVTDHGSEENAEDPAYGDRTLQRHIPQGTVQALPRIGYSSVLLTTPPRHHGAIGAGAPPFRTSA